MHTYNIS